MAEAVARVARKVNEVVENGEHHLDLSECALNAFPIGLYVVMKSVAQDIRSINLANNEIKALTGKFFTTFIQLEELNLAGNTLQRLPDEVNTLVQLKSINLSKNKIQDFPENLLDIKTLERINLEDNQIKDVPVDKLSCIPSLQSVNLKSNPINKDNLKLLGIKFELLI
ncbi:leucine-rich repeat-containing protein 20 [Xenopus laevis]|uniref:Leucine-rich repeat-containing protein 20 n=2 Tax=Xenopus laevis TaxID=8355 RepID=A0A1L8FJW2_XENLA|nr:leucine-rich repeat-containing protein 20 [Xenopus laevis]XP_041424756.1 leucine-rich repeat-containing protein 20 [Xenopus laevis]OCT71878.1 hypothetical protein XELAEV_18034855mg [Xenopus laevis]